MRKTKAAQLLDKGELTLETWLEEIAKKFNLSQLERLSQAGMLAQLSGAKPTTPIGWSCFHQGLIMAELLMELQLDETTLAAALIYPSVQFSDLTLVDIEEQLGKRVMKLVRATQQMANVNTLINPKQSNYSPATTDNLRKMLLAIVEDIRVVFIKLAECICLLKNMRTFTPEQKKAEAKEVMEIYAPLANRLGIGQLKWQLEDLAFRYLDPETYKYISKSLTLNRVDREKYVHSVVDILKQLTKDLEIKQTEITGRAKHIYSIYRKMQRKSLDVHEIYDVTAFRILVPTTEACYKVLSEIHTQWQPFSQEFDDYIAQPKTNGYRSIHTAVYGPDQHLIEIQIRTFKMHEEAELGMAAHWVYKEGAKQLSSDYEAKIAWLRQVMDWQEEVSATKTLHSQLFSDRVYIFTPQDDIIDLPKGATPLDFAYYIHSEIGHRCRGAKINGHIVPLTYQLQTGDRVEILTSKQPKPSRDWLSPHLNYLFTSRAKAKVQNWFKKQDYEDNLAKGTTILEKEFKRLNLKNVDQTKIARKLNYRSTADMLAGLGHGDIRLNTIINAFEQETEVAGLSNEEAIKKLAMPKTVETKAGPTELNILGVGNLLTHIAQCCKPIPGDSIIGYITQGKGISIHRQDCANILRSNLSRLIEVSWGSKTQKKYPVDLIIEAHDRQGLVRDISNLLATDKISILSLNCATNANNHSAFVSLTIEVDDIEPLNHTISRLQQVANVREVKRV